MVRATVFSEREAGVPQSISVISDMVVFLVQRGQKARSRLDRGCALALTDVQCVILQAAVTAQAVYPQHPPVLEDRLLLQNYLLEFYPREHSVRLVVSKTHPLLESNVAILPLGQLAMALQRGTVGTIYIPPTHQRPIADLELADRTKPRDVVRPQPPPRGGRPSIGPTPPNET
jgi:hypothetical protein